MRPILKYPKNPNKNKPGFTIVELLVVIVVIGILAGTTVVAYSGIQQNAANVRTAVAAASYQRALTAYSQMNGSYPAFSAGNGGACLGKGYMDRVGGDGIGDCGETTYPLKEDPLFETALKTLISSQPIVNNRLVGMPYQTSSWVGATIHNYPPDVSRTNIQDRPGFTVDGVSNPYYIMYILERANENCRNNGIVIPDEAAYGWPKMTANKPVSQTWSWSDGKTTACVVPLPNK